MSEQGADSQAGSVLKQKRGGFGRFFLRLMLAGGVVGLLAVAALGGLIWHVAQSTPDHRKLAHYEVPLPTTLVARDGSLLTSFSREKRVFTPYADIPPQLVHAFISAEDKTFFQHKGLDYPGIVSAALANISRLGSDKRPIGASTITQQLARNLLLTNEVSYVRKIKEALLAQRIETVLSKQRILELYLNLIFMGRNSYGVGAASQAYFGREPADLTIAQMAYLAALAKGPSYYHPVRRKALSMERRNWILGQMAENGYITPAERDAARAEDLQVFAPRSRPPLTHAAAFVEEVRRQLLERYGEEGVYRGGLWVKTTLDPAMQQVAETVMRDGMVRYDKPKSWRGPEATLSLASGDKVDWVEPLRALDVPTGYPNWRAAVVLGTDGQGARLGLADGRRGTLSRSSATRQRNGKPAWAQLKRGDVLLVEALAGSRSRYALRQTPGVSGGFVAQDPHSGRVLAMVGGFDDRGGGFNRATQAERQPGSAFKPFVYAAALENGFTPASIVVDDSFCVNQGGRLGEKCFKNFNAKSSGPQTLRYGLEQSRNLMTVRMAYRVGMDKIADMAAKTGVKSNMSPVLAMALGAGETTVLNLVNGYSILVNHGKAVQPVLIEQVQDRRGATIFRRDERACPACRAPQWDGQPMPQPDFAFDQALDGRTAYQVVHMLEGVVERGTARGAMAGMERPMAGKTGTTNLSREVWYVGMTPDLVAGLYIGYDTPKPLGKYAQGGSVAAPIWRAFAEKTLASAPAREFPAAPGVRFVRVDRKSGKMAFGDGPNVIWEAFKPSSEPNRYGALMARRARSVTVDSDAEFAEKNGGIY